MTETNIDELCARLRKNAEADAWIERDTRVSPQNLLALLDALDAARKERDKLKAVLLERHGGEPLALLKELDAARAELRRKMHPESVKDCLDAAYAERDQLQADLREALALLHMLRHQKGLVRADWSRIDALLERHKEQLK